jgi:FMN phosphatase YigB (HAD superfamily)
VDKIFIDYDSTLVDFQDVMTRQINQRENTTYTSYDMSRGYYIEVKKRNKDLFTDLNIYEEVKPLEGAIKFLDDIKELEYEIVLITANSSDKQKAFKEKHIEQYFENSFDDIIHTSDKFKYTKDSILIDDSYANILEHIQHNNAIGVLFNYEKNYINTKQLDLNISNLYHMDSFDEVYRFICEEYEDIRYFNGLEPYDQYKILKNGSL